MGLAEKRAVKEFQEGQFPELQKAVNDAMGFEVEMEVQWDDLAEDGMSHLYGEAWPKVYFQPLEAALKSICADDMGKEALQESLKKIVVQNKGGIYYGDRWASFEGGVLTLDHQPHSNIDDIKDREKGVTDTLEKAL